MNLGENPDLQELVGSDNELKSFIISYVGKKTNPEDGNVTVGNIVEVMASDFPEFLGAIAEENWIRGYQQAIADVEEGENLIREEMSQRVSKKSKKGKKN